MIGQCSWRWSRGHIPVSQWRRDFAREGSLEDARAASDIGAFNCSSGSAGIEIARMTRPAITEIVRAGGIASADTARRVVLFGIGSPILVEYVETCRRLGWSIVAAVKNRDSEVYFDDPRRIVNAAAAASVMRRYPCWCPMFTPANRAAAVEEAQALGFKFETVLVDPHAMIAATSEIGAGSYLNTGCIVGAETVIARHVLINRGASIGHHVRIGEFASVGPGAIVGGLAAIECGAMVGTGAIILPKVRIGSFAVVGAGAVVTRDVPDGATVVGNPARSTGARRAGFALPGADKERSA
jgi:sugar O-acyltransferase (sialic acid O-acetyltransferase NeuD family)